MNLRDTWRTLLLVASLSSGGCQKQPSEETPFRINATDAGFEAPESVPAGIRHIIFENHGSKIHEAMVVKLAPGMSAADYVAAVKAGALFPKGALDYSGAGLTSPGQAVEVWLKVDPGNYILICWSGGDATTVPVHPFTVQQMIINDEVPKEDIRLRLVDYRFELSGDLHKGVQVIRVETAGPSMHEVDCLRLHPGKTLGDIATWRRNNGRGSSPVEAMGGALDNHDLKRITWLRRNFSPGRYVLHCEMPVSADAQSSHQELTHADLGMVKEIDITE